MAGRTHNRWPYFFGKTCGNQMYWEGSKIYSTVLYPPGLAGLYAQLCEFIPFADQTPDCLPTFYRNGRKQLSLHQDKFGEDFFGRRELVILLFEGMHRNLIIKRGKFSRIIKCTPEVTIVLTHVQTPSSGTANSHQIRENLQLLSPSGGESPQCERVMETGHQLVQNRPNTFLKVDLRFKVVLI